MTVAELMNELSQCPKDMDVTTICIEDSDIYLKDITRTEKMKAVKDSAFSRSIDKRGKVVLVLR